jgi:ADP-ribosyl-[dinitrogen reductase] hydrolase
VSDTGAARSRVVGAFVGLAVGDALGAPVEAMSAEAIAERHPGGLRSYFESAGVRRGQVTDDTEMAFLVARSLIDRGRLDMSDVAARLIAWKDGGGVAGPSTAQGIEALRNGQAWASSGSDEKASSGCLPRCVPVALALPLEEVAEATVDCCRPTHRHELAVASSFVLNAVLARLIRGDSWEHALTGIGSDVRSVPGGDVVLAAFDDPGTERSDDAVGVLAQALAAVGPAASATEAVVTAVAAGGDTDTAGAVAGALAGARWGCEAISREWIQECESGVEAVALGSALSELRVALGSRTGP